MVVIAFCYVIRDIVKEGGFEFKIGLSIEAFCLYKGFVLGIWGFDYDAITGNKIVFSDLDDISNSEFSPLFYLKSIVCELVKLSFILLLVFTISVVLFISVLDHNCQDDNGERQKDCGAAVGDRDGGDHLKDCDKQEIDWIVVKILLAMVLNCLKRLTGTKVMTLVVVLLI